MKKPKKPTNKEPRILFEIHPKPQTDFLFLGTLLLVMAAIFMMLFAASIAGAPGVYLVLTALLGIAGFVVLEL